MLRNSTAWDAPILSANMPTNAQGVCQLAMDGPAKRRASPVANVVPPHNSSLIPTEPSTLDSKCLCCPGYSPVKLHVLLPLLDKYPQKDEADCLRNGFTHGFKLGYSGPREGTQASNPKSVNQNLDLARQKLMDEIKLGRMAGPFEKLPIQNLRVSPIGLIPKSLPGTFRLIHNLSYPEFDSTNEGIVAELN